MDGRLERKGERKGENEIERPMVRKNAWGVRNKDILVGYSIATFFLFYLLPLPAFFCLVLSLLRSLLISYRLGDIAKFLAPPKSPGNIRAAENAS